MIRYRRLPLLSISMVSYGVWDYVSLIPLVLMVAILVAWPITRNPFFAYLFVGAIVLNLFTELIKMMSKPLLQSYPFLQRPKGAGNCSFLNKGGSAEGTPGFPSGHVAVTAFIMTSLAVYYYTYRYGVLYAFIALLIIQLVAVSRVKRRCHNVMQVIVGGVLGASVGISFGSLISM